jgi:hypothetical protein
MNILRPENLGKDLIKELSSAKCVLLNAETKAEYIIEQAELCKKEIHEKAYEEGLLLGVDNVKSELLNYSKMNKAQTQKIESICYDVIRKILTEVVQDELSDSLKKSLSNRVSAEIETYASQLDLTETKITLELPTTTSEEEITTIKAKYPNLNIINNIEILPNSFTIKSPFGEIQSNPYEYIQSISDHLEDTVHLTNYI